MNHRARVLGTPLMLAVTYAHSDVARILLEHGADPGITTEFGNDALFFAAWSGDKQSLAIVKEYMDKRCRQASNLRQADR